MNKLGQIILLLVVACGAAEGRDLFADGMAIKLPEVKLGGKVVASAPAGDYVYPAFSPDGRELAYSSVVVRDGGELTAVLVLPLGKKTPRTLLSDQDSEKYAHYKAFVTSLTWRDAKHVEVSVSDGDVDSTELVIDARTGKIVSTKESEGAEDMPLTPAMEALQQQILTRFPGWNADDVRRALFEGAIEVPGRGVIWQRNPGENILFLNLATKQERVVLRPEGKGEGASLGGGFVVGGEVIFVVYNQEGAWLLKLAADDAVTPLAFFRMPEQGASVMPRFVSRTEAVFLLSLNGSAQRGDNPILYYSRDKGLRKVTDFQEVYDFDVSKDGRLMAVCHWEKTRKLDVVRISLRSKK